ncbi:MAG: DNA polymerase Y family protein, partial [Pseudonocardiaceae bacterium]
LVVPADGVLEFLHPLPVSALWGVGQRTAEVLHRWGCRTVADVANTPLPALRRAVGAAVAEHLHEMAEGRDDRRVVPDASEKSVGAEETFAEDVVDPQVLRRELLRLSERTTAALRRRGLRGRTIAVKIRYPDFTTITRSRTLATPTDTGQVVFGVVAEIVRMSRTARGCAPAARRAGGATGRWCPGRAAHPGRDQGELAGCRASCRRCAVPFRGCRGASCCPPGWRRATGAPYAH